MERRAQVVDLEFAERTPEPMPEPSPNPPMLPPFRRPHAPPPPPPSTSPPTDATRSPTSPSPVDRSSIPEPPRASLGNLPRRSMLAPEVTTPSEDFARGRDSDEHKGEEPEGEKHRKHRPRKKRRSRILSELRPVDGPQSALQPSVPDITDDDSQDGDNPLEAPDSGARAKEAFAAQRVRMRKAWCPDLRIYMKNAHPFLGICAAHRHHPYKRGDRTLVLFVAFLVAVLLCGLFAIRGCCSEVQDVPVTVVNRRLDMLDAGGIQKFAGTESHLRGHRRLDTDGISGPVESTRTDAQCAAYYADCSEESAMCAEGSSCRFVGVDGAKENGSTAHCVPDVIPSQICSERSAIVCPAGWACNLDTNFCVPASNYVCYLPSAESSRHTTAVQFATDSDDGTFTAIEAIFQILRIGADRHAAGSQQQDDIPAQQSQTQTSSSTASSSGSALLSQASMSSGSTSDPSSASSRSADSSQSTSNSSSTLSSASRSTASLNSDAASGSRSSESSSVKISLTQPVNGGVYSLSSSMLVEWHLTLLSGPDPGLDRFRVDFSADNGDFEAIAANVSESTLSEHDEGNTTVVQFEWDLADNTSWLCTTCVLRICALDIESASNESLCIRSDGKASNRANTRRLQTSTTVTSSGSGDDITFRIVREVLECSCGVARAPFLIAAVIIGACIPVVVLIAEPLVTFYRDRQLFGLFARRDGPVWPVIARYSAQSATRKGRVLLIVVLLALCVACGFVAAQITTTNFLTEKTDIIVLWVVTFAIAAAIGVLLYCTLVGFVLFNIRWLRERAQERREPSALSEFRNSLLPDEADANHNSVRNTA